MEAAVFVDLRKDGVLHLSFSLALDASPSDALADAEALLEAHRAGFPAPLDFKDSKLKAGDF